MVIETNNRELYEEMARRAYVEEMLDFKFFMDTQTDPDRIAFLFSDELLMSKRYERFEKKKKSELYDYAKARCFGVSDVEDLETLLAVYIVKVLLLKTPVRAYAFKSAIANTEDDRKAYAKMLKTGVGIYLNKKIDTVSLVDEDKFAAFITHVNRCLNRTIRQVLIAKAFYEPEICESNYVLMTNFSDAEKEMILGFVIQNSMDYILATSNNKFSPSRLDYEAMCKQKNAQLYDMIHEYEKLEKEMDALQKRFDKKNKKQTQAKPKTVTVYKDTKETKEEKKRLQNEVEELKNIIKELEDIIDLKEGAEDIEEDVLRDVRQDKILFVGGHENELRKLQFLFKNAECYDNCSTDVQANYLTKFDYIVFLTHYSSHALYHKIKGLADMQGVAYIHCEYNNTKLIAEYIAKHFPEKE